MLPGIEAVALAAGGSVCLGQSEPPPAAGLTLDSLTVVFIREVFLGSALKPVILCHFLEEALAS